MKKERTTTKSIDDYIDSFPPDVQAVLQKIRRLIRKLAGAAEERISYQMPAFFMDGVLIYFAAFKNHIGVYPPVRGDAKFQKDTAAYRGPKGNFKFPLDSPMPYDLIDRVVRFRLKEHRKRKAAVRVAEK